MSESSNLMGKKLHPYTEKHLKLAGWYAGRTVDTASVQEQLLRAGFVVYPKVQEFLSEFYGLVVTDETGPSRFNLRIDPLVEIDSYMGLNKHRLHRLHEKREGRLCLIGRTEINKPCFLAMDRNGLVYSVDYMRGKPVDLVGFTGYHAIENLLNYRNPDYTGSFFYKRIAPYNEDRIREILSSPLTIVSAGHFNSISKVFKDGYEVDRYFRQMGYQVYTVNPSPEDIRDIIDTPLYSSFIDIPESIDLVTFHNTRKNLPIIDEAIAAGVKIIFPSFGLGAPIEQARADEAGLEFIEGIGIVEAYKRVILNDQNQNIYDRIRLFTAN